MTLPRTDVAAVVNLHREGASALASLISAWRAVEHARSAGLSATLNIVIDDSDDETIKLANGWVTRGARIVPVSFTNIGMARNAAARALDAEWIAFLDGDDLWGESWLTRAHTTASEVSDRSALDVFHPATNVMFGASNSLMHHVDSVDAGFSFARLRLFNEWTSTCFVRREHLRNTPYPPLRLDEGYGYEDWAWNIEVLRRGGRHRVVDHAVHGIYRTPAGAKGAAQNLLARSLTSLRTPYPHTAAGSEPLPGQTKAVSERTSIDADLPAQYRHLAVELSKDMHLDIRSMATITPAISETIAGYGDPTTLPQNSNRHVTPAQRCLEELDLLRIQFPGASHGEVLERSACLGELPARDRHRVVAELFLDPMLGNVDLGSSRYIDDALSAFPQLRGQAKTAIC